MAELKGFPGVLGRNRPARGPAGHFARPQNWLDRRQAAREFRDRDPDVIVIGAGQSGLMAAARLGQLNIRTLVVDKSERVGDVWRKRYRSLTLHNEICMNHFRPQWQGQLARLVRRPTTAHRLPRLLRTGRARMARTCLHRLLHGGRPGGARRPSERPRHHARLRLACAAIGYCDRESRAWAGACRGSR